MKPEPGTPFVVFGDDWGRNVSTMQHIFRWIIPEYPVVWVNGIGHRRPRFTAGDIARVSRKARAMFGARRKTDALVGGADSQGPAAIVQPRVLPWHDNSLIYSYNVKSILAAVRSAQRRIGCLEPPILVTGSPPSAGVVGRLGERASIYFCMDDFLHIPSATPEMIAPLEESLLAKVDALVCTAESLLRSKHPRSGRAFYLPQGVNYDHFAQARDLPGDLAGLPRPIIGFAGALYERCDVELLQKISAAFPTGSLVLLGPVQMDPAPLRAPNVHILGPRPYADLPAYMQAFDVGIIPYVINAETVAVDPLKLLEYCAAGIPCVTTALPEANKYREVIGIAASHEEFVSLLGKAVGQDRYAARAAGRDLARKHTWQERALRFLDIVMEVQKATLRGDSQAHSPVSVG